MEIALAERGGERFGVGDDLRRIALEAGIERLAKAHRLSRDHVLEWPPLGAREERLVDGFRVRRTAENEPATWAAQRFVRRRRHDVRVRHRRWMHSGGDEAGEVG